MADLLYFEDFPAGEVATFGSLEVTPEAIKTFAREFDPQPFHMDEDLAKASIMGGLCASGWHVCAMAMRMFYDEYVHRAASLGSFGVDEIKWLKPVFAGDVLSCRRTTLKARRSSSRPEMGIVTFRWELFDAGGEKKTELTGVNLFKVRGPRR